MQADNKGITSGSFALVCGWLEMGRVRGCNVRDPEMIVLSHAEMIAFLYAEGVQAGG